MQRGELSSGWKSKYVVFMAEESKLYIFDSEDVRKRKSLKSLKNDLNYFGKKYLDMH